MKENVYTREFTKKTAATARNRITEEESTYGTGIILPGIIRQ
jgi:hypothetical protein